MRLYLKTKTILQLTSYLKGNNDCLIPKISIKDISSNLFFITALVVPDSAVRQEKKRKKRKAQRLCAGLSSAAPSWFIPSLSFSGLVFTLHLDCLALKSKRLSSAPVGWLLTPPPPRLGEEVAREDCQEMQFSGWDVAVAVTNPQDLHKSKLVKILAQIG